MRLDECHGVRKTEITGPLAGPHIFDREQQLLATSSRTLDPKDEMTAKDLTVAGNRSGHDTLPPSTTASGLRASDTPHGLAPDGFLDKHPQRSARRPTDLSGPVKLVPR